MRWLAAESDRRIHLPCAAPPTVSDIADEVNLLSRSFTTTSRRNPSRALVLTRVTDARGSAPHHQKPGRNTPDLEKPVFGREAGEAKRVGNGSLGNV